MCCVTTPRGGSPTPGIAEPISTLPRVEVLCRSGGRMTGSHMHWQVADGRDVGGEQPHRSPRGGRRILVFRVALERTRTPRYSLSSHPSYSRGALKTLHNTVLPPRGWRLQHGRHRAYPRPRRAPHGAAARHGQEREAEPTDSPADSGLPPNRLADMSANPYLMAAAIGAAGLDGLRARSVPPPPTDRKPRLPEITRDYPRLPDSTRDCPRLAETTRDYPTDHTPRLTRDCPRLPEIARDYPSLPGVQDRNMYDASDPVVAAAIKAAAPPSPPRHSSLTHSHSCITLLHFAFTRA